MVSHWPCAHRDLYAGVPVRAGENPYEVEIDLVDDLKPGEVAVRGLRWTDRAYRTLGRAAVHRLQSPRRRRLRH